VSANPIQVAGPLAVAMAAGSAPAAVVHHVGAPLATLERVAVEFTTPLLQKSKKHTS